ncbi:hypothetical protein ON010_g13579 [Phytophthora cinnamomi]|nr:hypothetical protein ON010_g13579 [Phytophthora cinnamomi]
MHRRTSAARRTPFIRIRSSSHDVAAPARGQLPGEPQAAGAAPPRTGASPRAGAGPFRVPPAPRPPGPAASAPPAEPPIEHRVRPEQTRRGRGPQSRGGARRGVARRGRERLAGPVAREARQAPRGTLPVARRPLHAVEERRPSLLAQGAAGTQGLLPQPEAAGGPDAAPCRHCPLDRQLLCSGRRQEVPAARCQAGAHAADHHAHGAVPQGQADDAAVQPLRTGSDTRCCGGVFGAGVAAAMDRAPCGGLQDVRNVATRVAVARERDRHAQRAGDGG